MNNGTIVPSSDLHGIIDKFNSLSVVDRDEESRVERERQNREMEKLQAALERAQMAREEAETEARKLREKMLSLQDERTAERSTLRERASDFEVGAPKIHTTSPLVESRVLT